MQHFDWNNCDIDFSGRGWDRGLRGIDFYNDRIFVAASDELFLYDTNFKLINSYRNAYLKHCHEICRRDQLLFLTSTGYDSLLVFDLRQEQFIWAVHISRDGGRWIGKRFNPNSSDGPGMANVLHLNMVHIDQKGVFFSGLRTGALLSLTANLDIIEYCTLPAGTHNARPFGDGVLFNDTNADCVRYITRNGRQSVLRIPKYDPAQIEFAGIDDSKIARQGFGRGLCPIDERLVAAGSSPSTITIYDVESAQQVASVNMSMDIRNAIHGLELWPYD